MIFNKLKILADENISNDLLIYLQSLNMDVISIFDLGLQNTPDLTILNKAFTENRIILTHDSDFGNFIYTTTNKFTGIIYLRPGHINAAIHVQTIAAIIDQQIIFSTPFMLIAENHNGNIKIRLRTF